MSKVSFVDAKGQTYQVNVPEPANADSFFAFSMIKSGSTLLHGLMADICKMNQMPVIDIPSGAFQSGTKFQNITSDVNRIIHERGYAYLGFRAIFQKFKLEINVDNVKNILLLRDPRDVLVSLFFSQKFSHILPKKGDSRDSMLKNREMLKKLGLDEFVLGRAKVVKRTYENYAFLHKCKQLKMYRYEDVIFEKEAWIHDMVSFLGMSISDKQMQYLLNRYDILPDEENPHAHIRQVKPGNYKKHLSQECIEQLNEIFSDVLKQYGYSH